MNKLGLINPFSIFAWLISGVFLFIIGAFLIRPWLNSYFAGSPSMDPITKLIFQLYPVILIFIWLLILVFINYFDGQQ